MQAWRLLFSIHTHPDLTVNYGIESRVSAFVKMAGHTSTLFWDRLHHGNIGAASTTLSYTRSHWKTLRAMFLHF